MAIGKVQISGLNTDGLPKFTQEKMRMLLLQAQKGDAQARSSLIQANLRLVLSVIQRFQNRGENADDLFQVGCIGLMKALDNFDPSLNVRLSTYCVPMIIGEIRRYLRDNNSIRVSRSLRDTAYRALKTRDELTMKNGREAGTREIAGEMQASEEDVALALEAVQAPVSLSEPLYQDGENAVYIVDQVKDESVSEENWVLDLSIRNALSHLSKREKGIIVSRFYEGRTQMEVASEIGISQAQVSRLEKSALSQMRRYV